MTELEPPADLAANGKPAESVWDFPRPPRLDRVAWRVRVVLGGIEVVDAPRAVRVLETSQPPAYYVERTYVRFDCLRPSDRTTWCEWKGRASYADVVADRRVAPAAAWTYAEPTPGYDEIAGYWAFYARLVDECWIDDERVDPNPGSFYGGWITANVTGPFKGGPGTTTW